MFIQIRPVTLCLHQLERELHGFSFGPRYLISNCAKVVASESDRGLSQSSRGGEFFTDNRGFFRSMRVPIGLSLKTTCILRAHFMATELRTLHMFRTQQEHNTTCYTWNTKTAERYVYIFSFALFLSSFFMRASITHSHFSPYNMRSLGLFGLTWRCRQLLL